MTWNWHINPEPSLELPDDVVVAHCDLCGGEIYGGESMYRIDSKTICDDCLLDFAKTYFEEYRKDAELPTRSSMTYNFR